MKPHDTPAPVPDPLLLAAVSSYGATVQTRMAAKITGRSKSLLEKLRSRGQGPPYARQGRLIVYRVDHLLKWANEAK